MRRRRRRDFFGLFAPFAGLRRVAPEIFGPFALVSGVVSGAERRENFGGMSGCPLRGRPREYVRTTRWFDIRPSLARERRHRPLHIIRPMAERRRSARVNAPAANQPADTPVRKPPHRRVPTPPQSTSRQTKRSTRVRPSLVAEILVSPDLLPHMLEHLSMQQLHRVTAVCRAFRFAVPTALLLRRVLCPKPTQGA